MSRKIVIESCQGCPHRSHKGAFGRVAYVPYCTLASRTLPYTPAEGRRGMIIASPSNKIPVWCQLEKNND